MDNTSDRYAVDVSVLRTEGLVKVYGKRTVANGVSINVRQLSLIHI